MDEFEVGELLGSGAFARVYLATHLPTHCKVAIKTIDLHKIDNQNAAKRLYNEIAVLKMLQHPHIAELYQVVEGLNEMWLVMEYI